MASASSASTLLRAISDSAACAGGVDCVKCVKDIALADDNSTSSSNVTASLARVMAEADVKCVECARGSAFEGRQRLYRAWRIGVMGMMDRCP